MSSEVTLFGSSVARVHCVGATGMGLGPLAIYLAGLGLRVTGEDDHPNPLVARSLGEAGIQLGTTGTVPEGTDLVVISSAVKAGHPALERAAALGVPVRRRGEVLAEVCASRRLIAICGSHGKTTTTAMVVTALRAASWDFGYILGGLFADPTLPPAAASRSEWVVAEVDESDGTIERYRPEICVAVNIDWDHPDQYPTYEDCLGAFTRLFQRTSGTVLANAGCPATAQALAGALLPEEKCRTFGPRGSFRLASKAIEPPGMRLVLADRFSLTEAVVRAEGEFNALNATAALATAQLAGATLRPDLLARYAGVGRRQAPLDAPAGFTVLEDYAHHPAEIRALLSSLHVRLGPGQRLLAVFQPHRFSRTAQFLPQFAESLAGVDWLGLLDVYGAGESPIDGGTTGDLYALLRERYPRLEVNYCGSHCDRLLTLLLREVRPGDTVVWVGAGDLDGAARRWVARLAQKSADEDRWDALAAEFRGMCSTDTRIRREEGLAERTTMRVGGAARLLAEPATEDDARILYVRARERGVPVHWLGRGSNLVVPDSGVEGLVLTLTHANWQAFAPQPDGRLWVGAGLRLKNLCGLAAKAGLQGFEFLEGIPGNVGGALRMNAGAMGGWMFDVVEAVRLLSDDGRIVVKRKAEMTVDYRHCADLEHAVALGAWLVPAKHADSAAVTAQIDAYREKRQKSQPREPSAGCIFKNPEGDHAGRLIDTAGLKGTRVGGALVSPIHANFIVNADNATSADVAELVRRVRRTVERVHGVTLNPEVILFGDDWSNFL
ncbi:UDP-N-acetylmuramate dehydrogenase [Nibricoccus sp. IMCC34717]|uniref:UDP-N-acetylmuramate dehydrogenase n=1 Tax=Nibricoccus sp. IMCC34717 TaxID=3034021 RepID=UPI00384DA122